MQLRIRSKLVLSTVLPVLAVYSVLFWLGVSHVREHLTEDAKRSLLEHAQHQASRLALVFSQIPALAEGLGDLMIADPEQSQELLYAHLIDGLRRTPIATVAAVMYDSPYRGALMRRGAPAAQELPAPDDGPARLVPGWHLDSDKLRFNRPIYRHGTRVGGAWVEVAITDAYAELERQRSASLTLFIGRRDGALLPPLGATPEVQALASLMPQDAPADIVQAIGDDTQSGSRYWVASVEMPGLPWRIIAATRSQTALEPARREASLLAIGLLLSLLGVVIIIGIATRQITRPLATLDASVQQIAQGKFTVAPEVNSDDELGRLAIAIRHMAMHIADRENQLRTSHQVLEQRVAERTSALQESNARLMNQIEETRRTEEALRLANDEAQQANRAKSEFLSNMSHELRTPLHGVLGYAQILRRDPSTSPSQLESLEAIERCGQHLLTLINDILDLTKIEAGQMRVDLQATDLHQLLEDVHMIVAQRAANQGLQLHMSLEPGLPTGILTDAVKLKQILLNLLSNAIKFTLRGSVTLHAAQAPPGYLTFEVADTGVGIPADRIDAVFDPFQQVHEGQAVDGTGLGLAINRRLIGLIGGEAFGVQSKPGAGSRFCFRIPYHAASVDFAGRPSGDLADPSPRQRLAPGMNCSVMIVDPLEESRNMLTTLLRYADCEVESLRDPATAIPRLRERAFDLVLLDARLPDPGAGETAGTMRQNIAFGTPKLVAMSANTFPGADQKAREAGFDGFLGKPFTEGQLFGLIGQLLGIRFETGHAGRYPPPDGATQDWPGELAADTANRIVHAIDMGDVGSLFQLAEELADNPGAPAKDVENMALMARLFDFDGLQRLSDRLGSQP